MFQHMLYDAYENKNNLFENTCWLNIQQLWLYGQYSFQNNPRLKYIKNIYLEVLFYDFSKKCTLNQL